MDGIGGIGAKPKRQNAQAQAKKHAQAKQKDERHPITTSVNSPIRNPVPTRILIYLDYENAVIPSDVNLADLLRLFEEDLAALEIYKPFTLYIVVASPHQCRVTEERYQEFLALQNQDDRLRFHAVIYPEEIDESQVSDAYIYARFEELIARKASDASAVDTVFLIAEDIGYRPYVKDLTEAGITVLLGRPFPKAQNLFANYTTVDMGHLYAGVANWHTLWLPKKIPKALRKARKARKAAQRESQRRAAQRLSQNLNMLKICVLGFYVLMIYLRYRSR